MKKAIYFFLFIAAPLVGQQHAITSAGGTSNTSKISVNWSIGNIVSGVSKNSTYTIYQGAPINVYEIIYNDNNQLTIACYPNPASNYFKLHVHTHNTEGLSWQITTLKGTQIKSESIKSEISKIDISDLVANIYLLTITNQTNQVIATGKISKK